VFDRFYRGGGTTEIGSGLGLAIAHTIASRYGAAIALEQAPTLHGLRVVVRFPGRPSAPS
jgi:two-component system OmpR family sensor kinase